MAASEAAVEAETISHKLQLFLEGTQPRRTVLQLNAEWMVKALPDPQQVDGVLSVFEERVQEAGRLKEKRAKSSQMERQDPRVTGGAFELHLCEIAEAHHSFDADRDVLA